MERTTRPREDEGQLCRSEDMKWHRNRWFKEVDRIAGRRVGGRDLGVIKPCGERLENLLEVADVAAVLHDMVELFLNALELFAECSQRMGVLVLIIDDAPLIGNDMSLHLSGL